MKKLKQIKEQMAMSAASPPIAGLPPDIPPVPAGVTTAGHMLRRSPPVMFGGKRVFKVPSDRYHKAVTGKKKYKHYSTYVGRDAIGEEIRNYIKENPDAPVILEDEITGAMVYLKYGKR